MEFICFAHANCLFISNNEAIFTKITSFMRVFVLSINCKGMQNLKNFISFKGVFSRSFVRISGHDLRQERCDLSKFCSLTVLN